MITHASKEQASSQKSHLGGFADLNREYTYEIPLGEIEGRLPSDFWGTFYRNGPGRNTIGGQKYPHWFDGDGMLHALQISPEKIHYQNRFVRTPKYLAETRAGAISERGFGVMRTRGFLANLFRLPANAANTSVVYHGERLLALWEAGKPYQLQPSDLSTLGECDFNGQLGFLQSFSAHGRVFPLVFTGILPAKYSTKC